MLCIFSHSWTWDQKQATWGQYQNIWSIDSGSSQQNLQSFEDFMPQIFNILLVARILYNNFSWKAQSCILRCFIYQLIHLVTWNWYIINLFRTILQSVWHSCQHPGPQMKLVYFPIYAILFLNQFVSFTLVRLTSSLPHPAATCLLHFWGNAVINWLYSWIE